ncbi:MAG TPA: phosphate ABC transporter substrate-binding protein PstS [Bryobacteraceae bacterium]|nr:phosphate ABC transporter substrate-binding protein PstS [Bryobacteraceae bacterium]
MIGTLAVAGLAGWHSFSPAATAHAAGAVLINGAGATFPYPIYAKWFGEYHRAHPDIQVNYQSIGSGGGIRLLLEGTVDFGASDMPMTDQQLSQAKFKVLHFPTVIGAVVPTYHIPGVTAELKFTPEALAGIFLGTVQKWNDASLVKANPGVRLPNEDIIVVHRSDGSGTTFVWTDYLSKVSADWKSKVGASTSVNWPVGLGGKGNEGVAGLVQQTPYALGYVELIYALQNKMAYGSVRNSGGAFIKADLNTVTQAAAAAASHMPADFRVSITNPPGRDAYPIASFTWLLIPERISNSTKKETITGFLQWMLHEGQKMTAPLSYAPLPPQVASKEAAVIAHIQ